MSTDGTFPLGLDPQTMFIFGIAIVAWIAMYGLSLKLAFMVCGANAPGYFSCLGYAFLIPVVNGLITTVALATIGYGYGLVGILQLYIQIKILKSAGDCGSWRAFFSGLVHGIFGGIGTVAILLGLVVSGTIDTDKMKGPMQEFAAKVEADRKNSIGQATQSSTRGSFMSFGRSRTADGAQINPYFNQQ